MGCHFIAKVKTNAGANRIAGLHDGMVVVQVTAAPEKGKANKAVIRIIAKALGVAPSFVAIVAGQTTSRKRIAVDGLSPEHYDSWIARLQADG